ncbi:MAG: hypothetical protein MUF64_03210 [Polyangiaceae bacterium]|nr:hypothetical protein [Polyangiaceae bacterium]
MTSTAQATPPAPAPSPAGDPFEAAAPSALLGLAAGAYRVTEVTPIHRGTFSLRLAGPGDDSFLVEICALDDSSKAQRGPARTSHLELFVKNQGHGGARTHEGRGLAVMALARSLEQHEHLVPVARLLPLRERQRRYQAQLYLAPRAGALAHPSLQQRLRLLPPAAGPPRA